MDSFRPARQDACGPVAPKQKAADKPKKVSALDAAAKVLSEAGAAMNCQELIEAMAQKGYWTSPGGKTPQATLYSAIAREIKMKGSGARFTKTERGKFALDQGLGWFTPGKGDQEPCPAPCGRRRWRF